MHFRHTFAFNLLVFIAALLSSVRAAYGFPATIVEPSGTDTMWNTATRVEITMDSTGQGLPRPKDGEYYVFCLKPIEDWLDAIPINTLTLLPANKFHDSFVLPNSDILPAGDFTLNCSYRPSRSILALAYEIWTVFLKNPNGTCQDHPQTLLAAPVPIHIPQ
ncbi:hypothetical protein BC826DRAFT_324542 [Russula brevipes]|nr:hypothetical protein BC826DRAFT_324542 [Russula brevipes]